MKIKIDENKCIGCGLCAALDPKTFKLDYSLGKAIVVDQPEKITPDIDEAISSCPVEAICLDNEEKEEVISS